MLDYNLSESNRVKVTIYGSVLNEKYTSVLFENKDLSLEEAILLSGIPKNPSNYNPVSNYDNAIKRAKTVAFSMYKNGFISKETHDELFKRSIREQPFL